MPSAEGSHASVSSVAGTEEDWLDSELLAREQTENMEGRRYQEDEARPSQPRYWVMPFPSEDLSNVSFPDDEWFPEPELEE